MPKKCILAVLILFFFCILLSEPYAASRAELAQISVKKDGSNFQSWNKEAASFKELTSYVARVTDPKSADFIPEEDRIAVFDLDGTLVCETTPSYFEWMLFLERALNDPSYTPSPEDKEFALQVKQAIYFDGLPNPIAGTGLESSPERKGLQPLKAPLKDRSRREAKAQAAVFAGMSREEYEAYVKKFMETPAEGLTNLLRGESFYVPMVELVSYLKANNFKLYIVSGTDRDTLRILAGGVLPIASDNIIGTDIMYVASHEGTKDPLSYVYSKEDTIVRSEFTTKNIKMNKVINIAREIGKKPVLAFGNSSGDDSMLNYTIFNNKYKALSFALLCDDTERELGNPKGAEKMRGLCAKNGWIPVSMKNDFLTIYGDKVKRADKK